jgi:HSP20 family protein
MTGSNRDLQNTGQQQGTSSRGVSRRQLSDPAFGFGGDLFRMNPFAVLRMMTEQMDRAFGEGFGGSSQNWNPALEVREKDGNLVVCADLPGLEDKDVKVEVTEDVLTIQGERRREHEEGEGRSHRMERSYGSFYRSIQLPEGAQADQAKAEFRNGVLEVTMPLTQPKSNRRQIPIQGGSSQGNAQVSSGSSSQSNQSQQNVPEMNKVSSSQSGAGQTKS